MTNTLEENISKMTSSIQKDGGEVDEVNLIYDIETLRKDLLDIELDIMVESAMKRTEMH
jgi:hypothetical protein